MKTPGGLELTQHAVVRCQQRGIGLELLDLVYVHGVLRHTTKGFSCYMDKRTRERARAAIGDEAYRGLAEKLNFYFVLDSERRQVLTVAHRLRRRRSG
jgi:hypothetical protein